MRSRAQPPLAAVNGHLPMMPAGHTFGVTMFPGLLRAEAEQHLRVTAEPGRMMQWLTDSRRPEQEWRRRLEQRADISDARADHLPDGRLRCGYELSDDRHVWRVTSEDVTVTENAIQRVHRAQLVRPPAIPVRWTITEHISVEPAENGTDFTVHAEGRMAGLSRLLHVLGYRDTTTADRLGELARLHADQIAAAVAGQFAGPPGPDEDADIAG